MQDLIVVENYRHKPNPDGSARPFVYRIFDDLTKALVYVETDIEYLLKNFYGVEKKDYTNPDGTLNRPQLKVFKEDDRIEYWMYKTEGTITTLDYARNIIRLNVKIWDLDTIKTMVRSDETPVSELEAIKNFTHELKKESRW